MERDPLTEPVIEAAVEVRRVLGPGLLESVHERCLSREPAHRGVVHERRVALPVIDGREAIDCNDAVDLVVPGKLIVELRSVEQLATIHEAQLLTYLKLGGIRLGLPINFDVSLLKNGVKRRILRSSSSRRALGDSVASIPIVTPW